MAGATRRRGGGDGGAPRRGRRETENGVVLGEVGSVVVTAGPPPTPTGEETTLPAVGVVPPCGAPERNGRKGVRGVEVEEEDRISVEPRH